MQKSQSKIDKKDRTRRRKRGRILLPYCEILHMLMFGLFLWWLVLKIN